MTADQLATVLALARLIDDLTVADRIALEAVERFLGRMVPPGAPASL